MIVKNLIKSGVDWQCGWLLVKSLRIKVKYFFVVRWTKLFLTKSKLFLTLSDSQLSSIEKKGAFLLKIAVLLVKIEKLNKSKNNFPMILLAIILLPLKYLISAMAKLRQFSPFLQQINKSVLYPFSKIQTRAPSLFPFVR